MFPKVNQRQFLNIVNSDKTLVSFLNTLEKSKTIHGLTKHNKRAVAAKKKKYKHKSGSLLHALVM